MSNTSVPHWRFSSEKARQELRDDPLYLLAGAEEVKSNTVRQVFRSGAYYIKLDRRKGKSFRGEFNAAKLCTAEKIPVVEHLAYGRSSEGSWLVTRAAENCVEAAALFKERQSSELYSAVAAFLKEIFSSRVYHPDLHLGNVLLDPDSGRSLLVDLHGVRKRNFFDHFRVYMMHRCIMEFRNTLSDDEMLSLIEKCGIKRPEWFFRKALAREAVFLQNVTPRRRRQILNGYFKYTRIEGDGKLVDVDAEESALNSSVPIETPDAEELFLFHFFLTQAKIPHRRILACEPGKNIIFMESELPEKYRSAAGNGELCRRLKYNSITSCEEDFKSGYLDDVAGVFRSNR